MLGSECLSPSPGSVFAIVQEVLRRTLYNMGDGSLYGGPSRMSWPPVEVCHRPDFREGCLCLYNCNMVARVCYTLAYELLGKCSLPYARVPGYACHGKKKCLTRDGVSTVCAAAQVQYRCNPDEIAMIVGLPPSSRVAISRL